MSRRYFEYSVGTKIVNSHGAGRVSFIVHDKAPFTISGVLAPTGTAVDRMVFVSLEGFETLHGSPSLQSADPFAQGDGNEQAPQARSDHGPKTINAIFVGLTDRSAVLWMQHRRAYYRGDALTAVLPNVALLQLWSITGTAETALRLMAGAVALAGVIGVVVMLSAAVDARRLEFAIFSGGWFLL